MFFFSFYKLYDRSTGTPPFPPSHLCRQWAMKLPPVPAPKSSPRPPPCSQFDGGVSADAEVAGHAAVLGAVDPADPHLRVGQLLRHLHPHGLQLLAVAAPRRVKLHQPRALLVDVQEPVGMARVSGKGLIGLGREDEKTARQHKACVTWLQKS